MRVAEGRHCRPCSRCERLSFLLYGNLIALEARESEKLCILVIIMVSKHVMADKDSRKILQIHGLVCDLGDLSCSCVKCDYCPSKLAPQRPSEINY